MKKKIFCLIKKKEMGVHALFCRLGFHVWDRKGYIKHCLYCPKEKNE